MIDSQIRSDEIKWPSKSDKLTWIRVAQRNFGQNFIDHISFSLRAAITSVAFGPWTFYGRTAVALASTLLMPITWLRTGKDTIFITIRWTWKNYFTQFSASAADTSVQHTHFALRHVMPASLQSLCSLQLLPSSFPSKYNRFTIFAKLFRTNALVKTHENSWKLVKTRESNVKKMLKSNC